MNKIFTSLEKAMVIYLKNVVFLPWYYIHVLPIFNSIKINWFNILLC